MEFFPVKADHMIGSATELPSLYVFRIGSSRGMIANDTGYFREETWQYLEANKFKLDLVICDCCGGILDYERGHMGGKFVLQTRARLEKIGCINSNTRFYINHFSHNGNATHAELQAHFNPLGVQVCYDGLTIDF